MRVDEWVKSLLSGCGKETEMLELQSILHQVVEEYFSGRMNDDELNQLAIKLCESIVVLANDCGKPLTQDKCVNDLVTAVKMTFPRGTLRGLITSMRRRRTSTSTSTSTGLIP